MTRTEWVSYAFTVPISSAGTSTVQMLSYDPILSRVRIDRASLLAPLPGLANGGFESSAAGWAATAGALTRSTAQHHSGTAAGLLTPSGAGALARTVTGSTPAVDVGQQYTAAAWVYAPGGWSSVQAVIAWLDASGTVLSSSTGSATVLASGVWTKLTATGVAPASTATASIRLAMTGTPTASNLLYVDDAALARSYPSGSTWLVERSPDLVRWTGVRAGGAVLVDAAVLPLDDYEFDADVENHYRVSVYSGATLLHQFIDGITPLLVDAWLKDIARPFLNRAVKVADVGDITRPSRGGAFAVVGRALPVMVTDVRGGRSMDLTVETSGTAADDLDVVLASGDVLFLHCPADYPIASGYFAVGSTVRSWGAAPPVQVPIRWHTLPLTEIAAPDPSVVGATATWQSVVNTYATWADLLAAVDTWADLVQTVAGVGDVEVG